MSYKYIFWHTNYVARLFSACSSVFSLAKTKGYFVQLFYQLNDHFNLHVLKILWLRLFVLLIVEVTQGNSLQKDEQFIY